MCDCALYIKCAVADMNVTDASEQWVCFCNLNRLLEIKEFTHIQRVIKCYIYV